MLRILQTTDLHAHALAFDYNNNNFFARRGLSRSALQIENAKATDQPCLLFDTGDFLQGSPIADRLAQEPETHHDTHPMITAMNLLGYDAATIGNHDLDFGIDHLAASLVSGKLSVRLGQSPPPAPCRIAAQTVRDTGARSCRLRHAAAHWRDRMPAKHNTQRRGRT